MTFPPPPTQTPFLQKLTVDLLVKTIESKNLQQISRPPFLLSVVWMSNVWSLTGNN